jgi:hypothetical protein
MKQHTRANHLTRTIQQLEQIEADEDFPAIQAASLLAETLCEIALILPEEDQQQIAKEEISILTWRVLTTFADVTDVYPTDASPPRARSHRTASLTHQSRSYFSCSRLPSSYNRTVWCCLASVPSAPLPLLACSLQPLLTERRHGISIPISFPLQQPRTTVTVVHEWQASHFVLSIYVTLFHLVESS